MMMLVELLLVNYVVKVFLLGDEYLMNVW